LREGSLHEYEGKDALLPPVSPRPRRPAPGLSTFSPHPTFGPGPVQGCPSESFSFHFQKDSLSGRPPIRNELLSLNSCFANAEVTLCDERICANKSCYDAFVAIPNRDACKGPYDAGCPTESCALKGHVKGQQPHSQTTTQDAVERDICNKGSEEKKNLGVLEITWLDYQKK
jgi:hypothetical protein